MFACRVMAGEVCKGHNDQLTPDERLSSNSTLFDTTVDTTPNPTIWVTYHDGQAYPEFLSEFTDEVDVQ